MFLKLGKLADGVPQFFHWRPCSRHDCDQPQDDFDNSNVPHRSRSEQNIKNILPIAYAVPAWPSLIPPILPGKSHSSIMDSLSKGRHKKTRPNSWAKQVR